MSHPIALTFDDGPYEPYTSELLGLLDELHVPAGFFFVGRHIERSPTTVRRALQSGHIVGNHSYTHPRMTAFRPMKYMSEVLRTDRLLRQLGVSGPIPFRPPYARLNSIVALSLLALGRELAPVSFFPDPPDWSGTLPSTVVASICEQVFAGATIVLHDGAPAAAPNVIETTRLLVPALRSRGFCFVSPRQVWKKGEGHRSTQSPL